MVHEILKGLLQEFKKPKSEAQYIIELKEIKQFPNETVWDFDQRFKSLMEQVNFDMSEVEHKEWFIATLVPHIRHPLVQQKIAAKSEALEIAMKLEASPIEETAIGMSQMQVNLTIQM